MRFSRGRLARTLAICDETPSPYGRRGQNGAAAPGRQKATKGGNEFVALIRQTLSKSADEQKSEIEAAGETPIFSHNQTDFVKDRVAIEIQFGKYAFVAYDLFVKHLAFYVRDQIDVGIEILAMKSLQSKMSSGPGYYEGELYNVVRNGRGVPAVPVV